jgi:hypothetical protein
MTEEEKEAQYHGNGEVGYLRECYDFAGYLQESGGLQSECPATLRNHLEAFANLPRRIFEECEDGLPYATKFLVQEIFEAENRKAEIPASKLREKGKRPRQANSVRYRLTLHFMRTWIPRNTCRNCLMMRNCYRIATVSDFGGVTD